MANNRTKLKLIEKVIFLENSASNAIDAENWKEIKDSFAQVNPIIDNRMSYLEGISFGNLITEEYFLFRLRFLKNISIKMRIMYKNRQFQIKRVIEDNRGEHMLNIIALAI